MTEAQKIPDVKYNSKQLSLTKPKRDAIVYKMHGDKDNPDDTVIIKDDYEMYYRNYAPFITALNGDLISKTFLFVGFSFTDPNLDYILSRIRIEYGSKNTKTHYAIIRNVSREDYSTDADYEYEKRKQELFIEDLKRYSIKTLKIDDYSEITDILHLLEVKINQNNVFVSGSACIYGEWEEDEAKKFIRSLSKSLINNNYNIISGFGLGVGSDIITGALEEIYMKNKTINNDRLLLRPFPQGIEDDDTREALWSKYRKDMISRAGISIFIFGNKFDEKRTIVNANGVKSEFRIAKELGNIIVPVGCTGYESKEIWNEVDNDFELFYGTNNSLLRNVFEKLNDKTEGIDKLIENIINFINEVKKYKR